MDVTLSQAVSSIQIRIVGTDPQEIYSFVINGTPYVLTAADVTGAHNINGSGQLTTPSPADAGAVSTIVISVPAGITSFSIDPIHSSSNINDASVFEVSVETDPFVMICFTSGTSIKTQSGERPIEELLVGDMVLTMDHGYQPIRWIGSSKRAATGDLAPILIRKGALGNDRDLRVSPQHRMLLQGWQAELMHGEREVLATAKSLINDHSIIRIEGGEVEYFHMLFDTHEIIWAEGAPSESFHPGEQGWKALDQATRTEILELFPELAEDNFQNYGPSARLSLKHKEGVLLGEHMVAPQA